MPVLDDLLWKSAGIPVERLIAALRAAAAAVPALSAEVEDIVSKLNVARVGDNLAALAVIVPTEFKDILSGKIDPREHPSDAA